MSQLHLAEHVSLPLDAVTQAIGVLAKRRAGKSYLARRFAEELLRNGQQVVIVDPKGDWWGIRSAADGKGPGFAVTILGGEHADVPLDAASGELVAHLVVEERVSVLLDLSLFSKGEVARFMSAFLETLYRLKAREAYRTPLMLIVDEGDAIAPQKPQKGEERMLGAANDIVRRGGQRGIGCMLVTQRSAVLNKNVLTQVELLITLRTIAPQDLDAINAWIDVHGTKEQRDTLMASLPSLPVGTAWFWSPGWPTDKGIFREAKVARIETFDSGATPRPGQKQAKPKMMAEVDLAAFRKRMEAAIEKVKENDPLELRRQILDLKRQLKAAPDFPKTIEVEVPVLSKQDRDLLCGIGADLEDLRVKIVRAEERLFAAADRLGAAASKTNGKALAPKAPAPTVARLPAAVATGTAMPEMDRKFLNALAQFQERSEGLSKKKLLALTGYRDTGSVSESLARLRRDNHICGDSKSMTITHAGLAALGPFEQLPTGADLVSFWVGKLDQMPGVFLFTLWDAGRGGGALSKADLLEAAGKRARGEPYKDTGSVSEALALLRRLDLITGDSTALRVNEETFT